MRIPMEHARRHHLLKAMANPDNPHIRLTASRRREGAECVPGEAILAKIDEAKRFVGAASEALQCGMHQQAHHLAGLARAAMRICGLVYPRYYDEAMEVARAAGAIVNRCIDAAKGGAA